MFSQDSYSASVVENLPLDPPAPIVQVTAHDKDEALNALIWYTITDGNYQGLLLVHCIITLIGIFSIKKNGKMYVCV